MRDLSPEFQAHLESGVTTLCTCWRLVRADGVVFGFTDHDRDLAFDGTVFRADTGGTPSALQSSADLAVDNGTLEGALSEGGLTDADLEAGRFDEADVEIFRVNWRAPEQRLLLKAGTLGEVRRGPLSFQVEFRGLAHLLDQRVGRIYQSTCDAVLGDQRCGVVLGDPAFTGLGQISQLAGEQDFLATGLEGFEEGWFALGVVEFLSGAGAGLRLQLRSHAQAGALTSLALFLPASVTLAVGDSFRVSAGCDKRFATCRNKFANGTNFRGMPHMPGNDVITSYPLRGENNDGRKR